MRGQPLPFTKPAKSSQGTLRRIELRRLERRGRGALGGVGGRPRPAAPQRGGQHEDEDVTKARGHDGDGAPL